MGQIDQNRSKRNIGFPDITPGSRPIMRKGYMQNSQSMSETFEL